MRCVRRGAEQCGGADKDCAGVGFAVGGADVWWERELGCDVVWILESSVGEGYAEAAGVGGVGALGVGGLPWSVCCGIDEVGVAEYVIVGGGFLTGNDGPCTQHCLLEVPRGSFGAAGWTWVPRVNAYAFGVVRGLAGWSGVWVVGLFGSMALF